MPMKVKITCLGTNLHYPLGLAGPYRILRRYRLETDTGLIDIVEEWDEPITPDGIYDMTMETFEKITAKPITDEEEW